MSKINIFWYRRDLRTDDNCGLYHALQQKLPVQTIFIFDTDILDKLQNKSDRRVDFIYRALNDIQSELKKHSSSLLVKIGKPLEIFKKLKEEFEIGSVYTNHDYEPYASERDSAIKNLLEKSGINFYTYKDQVIFEKDEIIKDDGTPYTVFTPYMKKWRSHFETSMMSAYDTKSLLKHLNKSDFELPPLSATGFSATDLIVPPKKITINLKDYEETRNIPSIEGTTRLSVHLRFGTVSVRSLFRLAWPQHEKWINELIWREFYMMILWKFPHVVNKSFRPQYDSLKWRSNEKEYIAWCEGKTGFPIVDAGMRQLNATGWMHNRVRMITSMFLSKYLLIDYKWGEAYFAEKLIDFELSSNNGGWQWSSGTGVDAAPYFRIFNMDEQTKRFDPKLEYIRKWVPEFQELTYPKPIVDYKMARERCLNFFKSLKSL